MYSIFDTKNYPTLLRRRRLYQEEIIIKKVAAVGKKFAAQRMDKKIEKRKGAKNER